MIFVRGCDSVLIIHFLDDRSIGKREKRERESCAVPKHVTAASEGRGLPHSSMNGLRAFDGRKYTNPTCSSHVLIRTAERHVITGHCPYLPFCILPTDDSSVGSSVDWIN